MTSASNTLPVLDTGRIDAPIAERIATSLTVTGCPENGSGPDMDFGARRRSTLPPWPEQCVRSARLATNIIQIDCAAKQFDSIMKFRRTTPLRPRQPRMS